MNSDCKHFRNKKGLSALLAAPSSLSNPTSPFYIQVYKRDLSGVGIGDGSSVLLGFISLTENLMMIGASVWMIWKTLKSAGQITPTSEASLCALYG